MDGTVASEDLDVEISQEVDDKRPLKVGRRLIYLHRLVGDHVETPKTMHSKKAPWHVTVVFVCYAICASVFILSFIEIDVLAGSNTALEDKMKYTPWAWQGGKPKIFSDITKTDDIMDYLGHAVMPSLMLATEFTEPTSFLSYNKVMSQYGFCHNESILLIGMRRMKATTDSEDTTTARFTALFPKTWSGAKIPTGSAPSKHDDTSDLWGSYASPVNYSQIPESHIGWYMRVDNSSTKIKYQDLMGSAGQTVWTKWEYTKPCSDCLRRSSLQRQGGYYAAIAIRSTAARQRLNEYVARTGTTDWHALNEIVGDQFVHLLSDTAAPFGACGQGLRMTNIMRWQDFKQAAFIDKNTASVSLDFMLYNANNQLSTNVVTKWDIFQTGVVAYPNTISVTAIKFDLASGYYVFWEVFFVFGTCFYFIELFIYKSFKYRSKLLSEFWTYVNAASTISSIASMCLRIHYSDKNTEYLKAGAAHQEEFRNQFLTDQMYLSRLYQTFSAVALLTIWIRVVELLASTPPRVQLLEKTLMQALGNVFTFMGYIVIVMAGFWAFAAVFFANVSLSFVTPFRAFISIFELLCLNVQSLKTTKSADPWLRRGFLFGYMTFAIISVQMFNSITNYAYNRVSEEMEPIFKRAERERKKRKDKQKGIAMRIMKTLRSCWFRFRTKILQLNAKENEDTVVAEDTNDKSADVLGVEDLLPADKERLENYHLSLQKQQTGESFLTIGLYLVFVISYIASLVISLNVQTCGQIATAVGANLDAAVITSQGVGGQLTYQSLMNVTDIYSTSRWMTEGLPEFVYGSNVAMGPNPGFGTSSDTPCLQSWNCFYSGTNAGSPKKMVRITQRLQRRVANTGLAVITGGESRQDRFQSGSNLIQQRGPAYPLSAIGANDDIEDFTTSMDLVHHGHQFCRRDSTGGYRDAGGIVCLLDADRYNMTEQLAAMVAGNFYSLATGTIVVDMVMYNSNTNGLVYLDIKFTVRPSGHVVTEVRASAFPLLRIDSAGKGTSVSTRVFHVIKNCFSKEFIFIIIYILLVVYFVVRMSYELRLEAHRKWLNDRKPTAVSVLEFFHDFFHILDLASYIFSIASLVFYLIWMILQLQIEDKVDEGFSSFLTYISDLDYNCRQYARISALNLLMICVRPLKYFRNDPRMAKINLTFLRALEDISWFMVMLAFFFIGFILFALIIFGIYIEDFSTPEGAMVRCFQFLVGQFDFWELWEVSNAGAFFFVFTFLFLFKFFFLNVFFAIIDKFFVSGDPPPFNWKRALKPAFGRLVRWIEWDDDYTLKQETDTVEKKGPLSRSARVHAHYLTLVDIRDSDDYFGGCIGETSVRKTKSLSDVCDVDDRMQEVLVWSRHEAKEFVEKFRKHQAGKTEFRNDDLFLKTRVKVQIDEELAKERGKMEDAERQSRYSILVNEAMKKKDQETLSRYILRLEDQITKRMVEKHSLLIDVYHLRAESEKMRYADPLHLEDEEQEKEKKQVQHAKAAIEAAQAIADDEDSDAEYAVAPVEDTDLVARGPVGAVPTML